MANAKRANPGIAQRKSDHLRVNLEEDVRFRDVSTGLESYRFVHNALPEIAADAIDLSTGFFKKQIKAPILLSCMTGGVELGARINQTLAEVAQTLGLAMGVGSQRAGIEHPERALFYRVRHVASSIPLLANLGAVQLNYGYGVRECLQAVDMIEADALVLHLNPLQEILQPEGNTNFGGLLKKIEAVCRELPVPVIVKEVGWGISESAALRLAEAGVAGIDVAGSGGTSWSEVEKRRSRDERQHRVAGNFAGWGIPTARAILMAKRGAPDRMLIASGGVRTGIDVAKCIALGADLAGIASPALKAAAISANALMNELGATIDELRISMFCIGAENIEALKRSTALEQTQGA